MFIYYVFLFLCHEFCVSTGRSLVSLNINRDNNKQNKDEQGTFGHDTIPTICCWRPSRQQWFMLGATCPVASRQSFFAAPWFIPFLYWGLALRPYIISTPMCPPWWNSEAKAFVGWVSPQQAHRRMPDVPHHRKRRAARELTSAKLLPLVEDLGTGHDKGFIKCFLSQTVCECLCLVDGRVSTTKRYNDHYPYFLS